MSSNIETNGAAFLKTTTTQALDAKKAKTHTFLGSCIRGLNTAELQDAVEEIVEKVTATMDDDMTFPHETWAETADRVETCYPAVAVVLRIAQERYRDLDPTSVRGANQ